jgi:hypothetical protein
MGINFSRKKPEADLSHAAGEKLEKVPEVGRERLRHFDAELAKGQACVSDLEARCARLSAIITDAATADQALQAFIAADGGIALAAYSAGQTTADDEIAKLIAAAKSTSEAAAAAKAALPTAETALGNARSQVTALDGEKAAEIARVVAHFADHLALAYKKSFAETARLHDQLLGFARATSSIGGGVALIEDELTVPRFGLPSLERADGQYDPYMRHYANDFVVAQSSKVWATARARLEIDVDADLSDLVTEGEK